MSHLLGEGHDVRCSKCDTILTYVAGYWLDPRDDIHCPGSTHGAHVPRVEEVAR